MEKVVVDGGGYGRRRIELRLPLDWSHVRVTSLVPMGCFDDAPLKLFRVISERHRFDVAECIALLVVLSSCHNSRARVVCTSS